MRGPTVKNGSSWNAAEYLTLLATQAYTCACRKLCKKLLLKCKKNDYNKIDEPLDFGYSMGILFSKPHLSGPQRSFSALVITCELHNLLWPHIKNTTAAGDWVSLSLSPKQVQQRKNTKIHPDQKK